jgi:hypothetical protein
VPTPFQADGTPYSIGDMVDNHAKEKGLPPQEDEFLDTLGLGDVGLKKACLENHLPSKRTIWLPQ